MKTFFSPLFSFFVFFLTLILLSSFQGCSLQFFSYQTLCTNPPAQTGLLWGSFVFHESSFYYHAVNSKTFCFISSGCAWPFHRVLVHQWKSRIATTLKRDLAHTHRHTHTCTHTTFHGKQSRKPPIFLVQREEKLICSLVRESLWHCTPFHIKRH